MLSESEQTICIFLRVLQSEFLFFYLISHQSVISLHLMTLVFLQYQTIWILTLKSLEEGVA